MQHRVLWTPYAEHRLEALIAAAADRSRLAAAAREIDNKLMKSATRFGESRYESMRVGFVRPLGVQFEVMTDVRTVIVHDVWRVDRKKGS